MRRSVVPCPLRYFYSLKGHCGPGRDLPRLVCQPDSCTVNASHKERLIGGRYKKRSALLGTLGDLMYKYLPNALSKASIILNYSFITYKYVLLRTNKTKFEQFNTLQ